MESTLGIKEKIDQMAELALMMLSNTFEGFMNHDLDMLAGVLKEEDKLNDMERSLSFSLVESAKEKSKAVDNRQITLLVEIIADLEEIGDYVKDMIERIEIKIQEKLFFSDDALSEYRHLYSVAHAALSDIIKSLKMNDKDFAKRILGDEAHIDRLLVKYREAHTKRLITGVCDPRAGNMFLNLLDFTAQIFRHTRSVADSILDLK
ncbi:PhoU domain-containing protein [Candidatus Omnitrophota bacterium]